MTFWEGLIFAWVLLMIFAVLLWANRTIGTRHLPRPRDSRNPDELERRRRRKFSDDC